MIGERMTTAELREKFPYMYVLLEDMEYDDNNALCSGIVKNVYTIKEARKIEQNYIGEDCPYLLLPTFDTIPFPMCLDYDIVF